MAVNKGIVQRCIVQVLVRANGRAVKVYALLDTGADFTMICKDVADKLGLRGKEHTSYITTVHAKNVAIKNRQVAFEVASLDDSFAIKCEDFVTQPTLNMVKRRFDIDTLIRQWPHLADILLPPKDAADVKLIIGEDNWDALHVFHATPRNTY